MKKLKVDGVWEFRRGNWALMIHRDSWKRRKHWSTLEFGTTKPVRWTKWIWKTWRYRSVEIRKYSEEGK